MASFNQATIVGNLTRDIELRYTPSGTAVTDVSVAVNDRVKRGEEWVDEVSYFEVTLWGRKAEVASEYLGKGSPALFSGKLKQDRWEKDSEKFSKVKLIANEMQLLSNRGGGSSAPVDAAEPAGVAVPAGGVSDDDIPF